MSLLTKLRANYYHFTAPTKNEIARKNARVNGNGIKAFWWNNVLNFGDLVTEDIISHFGFIPILTKPQNAALIGVGSIIGKCDEKTTGIVLGSGLIEPKPIVTSAEFLAVRGYETKRILNLGENVHVGDPGLLASKLYQFNKKKKYEIGLVPHYADRNNPWIKKIQSDLGKNACIIDVQDWPYNVAKRISQCDCIISSSLHGIIFSDSFNIPNIWVELSENVIGHGFKFKDYNSAIDYEQAPIKIKGENQTISFDKLISSKNERTIQAKINELHTLSKTTLERIAG